MISIKDTKTGKQSKIIAEIIQDNDAALSLKLTKMETGDQ